MADRKDLYNLTAQIVAGGILMAAGPAPMVATGTVAVGLAGLAGRFRDKASAELDAAVSKAVKAADDALRDIREFTEDDFARAAILLDTAPRTIDPVAYAGAARHGDPEPSLIADVVSAIAFEPDDAGPRRLVELLLAAIVPVIINHPSMAPSIARAFDLQNAQQVNTLVEELRSLRETTVPQETLFALAWRVNPDVGDRQHALKELSNLVDIAARFLARGEQTGNLDAFVSGVLAELNQLTEAGDLDTAAQRARERLSEAKAGVARLRDAAIDTALLARDSEAAAALMVERVNEETPDPSARFTALFREQNSWVTRGRDRGLNLDLDVAIHLGRMVVKMATGSTQRGAALSDLGSALLTRGQRESDSGRLEEALEVCSAALKELDRSETRHLWVGTMINFANTLAALGERETGTERLEDAIVAFNTAIPAIPRAQRPLDWAMANIELGNVLSTLGQRVPGSSYLDDAVRTFGLALPVVDRERTPQLWSSAQNNLGKAHASLGERGPGTRHLKKAVRAFRSALEERSPSNGRMEYAITQNNLGNALQELGKRLHDSEKLRDSVTAYEESLTARPQEMAPYQWANTQSNLGNALTALGVEGSGLDNFKSAIVAFRKALIEMTRDRSAQQWTIIQMNLADALRNIGEQELSIDSLEESILISQEIIDQSEQEEIPLLWANTVGNQGWARLSLAEITLDSSMATTALSQLYEASRQLRAIGHPPWAETFERLIPAAEGLVEQLSRPP